jgi:hypothetical protein
MKRVLFVLMAILGTLTLPCSGLAGEEQTLRDVKYDDPAKQSVAAVIMELENYYNNDKPEKLMSLFSDDAKLLTGMKGNRKGDWVSKKEYAGIVESKLAQLAFFHMWMKYYKPTLLDIKDQAAVIKVPYKSEWDVGDFMEKGFFKFDLEKVADKWMIKKMYWEVTEPNSGFRPISDPDSVCF